MTDDNNDLITAHRDEVHKAPPHLKAQWHATIEQAAALERGRNREPEATPSRNWFFGFALAAALTLGIGIGIGIDDDPVITEPASAKPSLAFSRGLRYHLGEARAQLVSYDSSADSTNLVLDIIEQNRLFEVAAEQNNAPKIARVLRAFEPILLELAADDIAPEDAAALREQLTFELNVMLTKLARDASDETHTT